MAVIVTLGTVKRLCDQDHFTDNNNDEMRSSYTISDLSDALMPLFITSQSFGESETDYNSREMF